MRHGLKALGLVAGILLAAVGNGASTPAGDKIYWGNENGALRSGPLGGSAGAADMFAGATPCGVAIDPAAGKVYWASWGSNAIRVGNLDGTGAQEDLVAGESGPCGVAIDPAANKIYWASYYGGTIRSANLADGSNPVTLVSGQSGPSGVAIDPGAGKIYWTNQSGGQVRRANLADGSNVEDRVTGQANPLGVALDLAAGKMYWANLGTDTIASANLDGTNVNTLVGSAGDGPAGVAIDPAAGKIYWATFYAGTVRVANLSDGSGVNTLFGGESASNFPALLRTPAGTAPPGISESGAVLTCSQGSWAPDLLGAFLFRAPSSFAYQWQKDGSDVATGETYTPTGPGSYTCRVTASNHAGSASQTSDPFTLSSQATLAIGKFYDANANRINDDRQAIAGWKVQLSGTPYLTPQSLTLDPDSYTVTESDPVETNWRHTTPASVAVSLDPGGEATVEFGNVCLGGGGGLGTGFWANKNGQALFGADDLALMRSLNLRNADGTLFDPTSYSAFKGWLGKVNSKNMANDLSGQLAAMELNVLNDKVNGSALISAPGSTHANAAGYATVNALMDEANVELGLNGLTKAGSPYRAYQSALRDALLAANGNTTFVQPAPCAFSFP